MQYNKISVLIYNFKNVYAVRYCFSECRLIEIPAGCIIKAKTVMNERGNIKITIYFLFLPL